VIPTLSDSEIRVLGCLMEKSVTTPDQYPLTLTALTNACNQKSSRNPVMSMEKGEVGHTLRSLEEQRLVSIDENFKSGVKKYRHLMHKAQFSLYEFDAAQFAVLCLLFLRGPQTPGELRTRSGRLHLFADNSEVVQTLTELSVASGEACVIKLPRTPGRRDAEYMHLFGGPVDIEAYAEQVSSTPSDTSARTDKYAELSQRVTTLEQEVARLRNMLSK